ncbi:MAG: phospholipid carrier-dependent glycosyltransferase [Novosphingobium sp.]
MQSGPAPQRDPLIWCIAIALAFLGLVWHRLGIPSKIYFDEVHYVPAARKLLQWEMVNTEHPMLGKQILAAAISLLGDKPLSWRIPSALFGAFGLFAFGRLIWHASHRRFATLAGMFLLATSFAWFIQSRIAMLDMFMAAFGICGLWQVAVALNRPARRARWHLLAAGVLFGLSMGVKWSMAPAVALPGLAMLALRFRDHGRRFIVESGTRPLPGIALWEAGIWIGLVPLAIYWATYMPGFLMPKNPIDPLQPLAWHRYMIRLQDSVTALHTYRSIWPDWVVNWRAVWYLYQEVDSAQRGVLLIGNPFSMLAGLSALLWCLWAGLWRRRHDALAFAGLYLALLSLWIVSEKPIQFYYHYLMPGTMLMACLSLGLDDLWNRGGRWRWFALSALGLAGAMFVWFYPIISAAMLHNGKDSYAQWMWLAGWR